jgi:polysaccharide export outer membrane protein
MSNKERLSQLFMLAGLLIATAHTMPAQQLSSADSSAVNHTEDCNAPVTVYGEVLSPSRFELRRRVSLHELIALVGGLTQYAKGTVEITHTEPSTVCEKLAPDLSTGLVGELETYNVADVWRDDKKMNPYLRPGDIIYALPAHLVYVVGRVLQPQRVRFTETLTVLRAVAMAGGLLPNARTDKIYIQRVKNAKRTVIPLELKAIKERRAEDVPLQPSDVVEVLSKNGRGVPLKLPICIDQVGLKLPLRIVY